MLSSSFLSFHIFTPSPCALFCSLFTAQVFAAATDATKSVFDPPPGSIGGDNGSPPDKAEVRIYTTNMFISLRIAVYYWYRKLVPIASNILTDICTYSHTVT